MDGILNVYKEKGYTSHDAVAIAKRCFYGTKTGHAGTLDPDAEGVLIILLGRATKLSDYIMDGEKEYRAEVTFGAVTDTCDGSGKVISEKKPEFSGQQLLEAINSFQGKQQQTPPMYSAVKVNGKKLYDLAREGKEIERKSREIEIYDISLEHTNGCDKAVIYIRCSKGTYVRTICHELGEKLGCGAHMSALLRTKTCGLRYEDGIKISDMKKLRDEDKLNELKASVHPIEYGLKSFEKLVVLDEAKKILYNGGKICYSYLEKTPKNKDSLYVVYDKENRLIGIYQNECSDGKMFIKPKTMLL